MGLGGDYSGAGGDVAVSLYRVGETDIAHVVDKTVAELPFVVGIVIEAFGHGAEREDISAVEV